jgi:hypothetical protein
MATDTNYSYANQLDLKEVYLYKNEKTLPADRKNLLPFMVEFNIFEDLFSSSLTAAIVMADGYNLVDRFAITGGERIHITYRTMGFANYKSLDFSIYKIGNRNQSEDLTKIQTYVLHLVTVDKYVDNNTNVSMALPGTWDQVVALVLKQLATTKLLESDIPLGNQSYVSPFWSPLKVCEHAAKRAYDETRSPFLFYETQAGYKFRSLNKLMHPTAPFTTLYIESKNVWNNMADPNRSLNTVTRKEYLESLDRMKITQSGAMGYNYFLLDYDTMNITKGISSYDSEFGTNIPGLYKNPLPDDFPTRNLTKFLLTHYDNSHTAKFERIASMNTLDIFKLNLEVPGNSELSVGSVVNIDIPSKSGFVDGAEVMTSGNWLVTSCRHQIHKMDYSCVIEVVKNSFENPVVSPLK